MIDMRTTVIPKSDQLNADSLIGQTKTIKVTKVSLLAEADQPIAIGFEGDDSKPYKPCKSMRRVLVNIWGPDGNAYIGRSMTIYRDDKVMFGGAAVGGIRISHMSHIDNPVTMALTVTRANRKPFTVQPLAVPAQGRTVDGVPADVLAVRGLGDEAATAGMEALSKFWTGLSKAGKVAVGGAAQLAAWKTVAEAADAPDIDFDNSPPSSGPPGEEAAAGQSGLAERRAGSPTNGLEGGPAPVPQHESSERVDGGQTSTLGEAVVVVSPPLEGVAASPPGAAAPSVDARDKHPGQVNGNVNAINDAIKLRTAEIHATGDARAQAGTAALTAFLEELRKDGEDGLVTSIRKGVWRDTAKALDQKNQKGATK